ncbi:MAG: segregation/condensation protein A [Chloroflexi bacterium]|nr:segregation/condensation protein A [Chloroflexota bacterium]
MTSEPDRQVGLDEVGPESASSEADSADAGIEAGPTPFEVSVSVFTGPVELLLHLIERNELDITEVSLLDVTEQYLRQIRSRDQIDLSALAEFIGVGARLLLLKSRALLPRDPDETPPDDDEESDVRQLIEALRDYRRFKQAAEFLREREVGHGSYRREVPPPQVSLPSGLDTVTLSSLVDVIREVIDRMPEEDAATEIEREPVRLGDRMHSLVETLQAHGRTSFRALIQSATSRTMVIVDFMAVLELIKQRYLAARQSDAFGDIELVRLEGAEPPEFTRIEEDFTGA